MSNPDTTHPNGERLYVQPVKPISEMSRAEIEAFVDQIWTPMNDAYTARKHATKPAARKAPSTNKQKK